MKKGYQIGEQTFKVHLDGVNLLPFLSGKEDECPREGFLYWSDDGDLLALRVRRWKVVFAEQRNTGMGVWREPFSMMRLPNSSIFAPTRSSAAMRATSSTKMVSRAHFLLIPAQTLVAKWLESFKEFPPRAEAASFTIDKVVEKLMPRT